MPLWIIADEKSTSISILIDSSRLISLQELKGKIKAGDALEFLYLIAQAAYTVSDYLLNVDLRLLSPELIFFESAKLEQIRIVSLPVPETTDITVSIDGQEYTQPGGNNLIRWLGAENAWAEELIRELNRLFLNMRWAELLQYLRELINQVKSQLAEAAARDSISEVSKKERRSKMKLFQRKRSSKGSLSSAKTKICEGKKGDIIQKMNAKKQKSKKNTKSKSRNSVKTKLRSWGDWLGITTAEKRQSELIDLEPTENLPNRMPNYRLAMLSEGLPGTKAEDEGQKAFILVDEFIIGRDTNKSDLLLDSAAVGRRHARIIRRGENFFIEDLGSINNTLMDGKRIEKYREVLLPDRCRLTFADRSFYFSTDSS